MFYAFSDYAEDDNDIYILYSYIITDVEKIEDTKYYIIIIYTLVLSFIYFFTLNTSYDSVSSY